MAEPPVDDDLTSARGLANAFWISLVGWIVAGLVIFFLVAVSASTVRADDLDDFYQDKLEDNARFFEQLREDQTSLDLEWRMQELENRLEIQEIEDRARQPIRSLDGTYHSDPLRGVRPFRIPY